MDIPVIHHDRLRLLSFGSEHLTEAYISWLNDPVVVRYSEQRHRHHTAESCSEFAAAFTNSPDSFVAIEADGFGHIGNMTICRDPPNGVADLSIMIGNRACWGKGIGTIAWRTMMKHLFRSERMRKITAGTMSENGAMLGLMERAGMSVESRRNRQFILNGREIDLVMAAAFAESWLEVQQ